MPFYLFMDPDKILRMSAGCVLLAKVACVLFRRMRKLYRFVRAVELMHVFLPAFAVQNWGMGMCMEMSLI